jgi:hypothetical protein
MMIMTDILGGGFEEAIRSKRIRVGRQQLCQWYVMTRADPDLGKHIYSELHQHPEITMKVANHFIRVMYDDFRPRLNDEGRAMARNIGVDEPNVTPKASAEPEIDPDLHSEVPDRLTDEELENVSGHRGRSVVGAGADS